MEKELNDNQKQIEFEESKSSANLSNQKALSCDMQNQTLAENEESQNLLNNEARLIMEKEEVSNIVTESVLLLWIQSWKIIVRKSKVLCPVLIQLGLFYSKNILFNIKLKS